MIDERIKLTVLESNNGVFTDHSEKAVDYLRDNFTITQDTATDYLYIGFSKPINAVYVDLATVSAVNTTITVQQYNGASWVAISSRDETLALQRSGFISWDREDMTSTVVNSLTKYWVRLKFNANATAVIKGINLVFSDDEMLKREFPNIMDPRILGSSTTSHIIHHVAARNLMIQTLRNEGYIKYNDTTGYENINQWDLLDIYEIREAASYLALSKIFFILSDQVDDNWWTKHLEYSKLYSKTFDSAKLSLDLDDDGVTDVNEKLDVRKSMRFSR